MKKKSKGTIIIIVVLLLVTAGAALLHLTTRTEVLEGVLLVEKDGIKIKIETSALTTKPVVGTIINGKGEEIAIDSPGILLSKLLSDAGVVVGEQVVVYADDEYSAVITAAELNDPERVFLLVREGERPQLVVFGDPDSKRNVSGVIRLVVA